MPCDKHDTFSSLKQHRRAVSRSRRQKPTTARPGSVLEVSRATARLSPGPMAALRLCCLQVSTPGICQDRGPCCLAGCHRGCPHAYHVSPASSRQKEPIASFSCSEPCRSCPLPARENPLQRIPGTRSGPLGLSRFHSITGASASYLQVSPNSRRRAGRTSDSF